jgi:hypothetical protein
VSIKRRSNDASEKARGLRSSLPTFAKNAKVGHPPAQLVTISRLVIDDSSQASRPFLVREMPRLYDF